MELPDLVLPEGREVSLFEGHSFGGEIACRCAVIWEERRGYAAVGSVTQLRVTAMQGDPL